MALIVIGTILKPYKHQILNFFLFLAILIPLADNVSKQLSTAIVIIVIILPLIFFIALELIVHKENIKTVYYTKITANFKTKQAPTPNNNNDIPIREIGIIIDDNMRRNTTICEMYKCICKLLINVIIVIRYCFS